MALTDHSRVTVVAPTGMTADALTKVLSVLGPQKGMKLIEDTPQAAARLVPRPQRHPGTLPIEPLEGPAPGPGGPVRSLGAERS